MCQKIFLLLVLILILADPAFASPAFVQGNGSCEYTNTASLALNSPVQSGNTILVFVQNNQGVALNSISDNCGGTYTLENNNTNGSTAPTGNNWPGWYGSMAYGTGSSGSCTITANYSGALGGWNDIIVTEVSGVSTFDQSSLTVGIYGSGSQLSSGNVTTSSNGEYIIGFNANCGGGGVSYTAGSGFTLEYNDAAHSFTEDQIQSSSGSIAAIFSIAGTQAANIGLMTFKAAQTTTNSIIGGKSTIGGVSAIN